MVHILIAFKVPFCGLFTHGMTKRNKIDETKREVIKRHRSSYNEIFAIILGQYMQCSNESNMNSDPYSAARRIHAKTYLARHILSVIAVDKKL